MAQDGPAELLIGMEGRDFVSNKLAELPPIQAVREIQSKAGLQHPLCIPLLGMADQLGITRHDAHRGVLVAAKQALLTKVQQMKDTDKVKLERLLNASFKYLGIQELRDVPVAVMEKLEKVPPVFLKQLTADKQIFRDLPPKVQRQVWEFDKNQLQQDALPPVGQYKYEVATIMRALAMDEFLPSVLRATAAAATAATPSSSKAGMDDGDDSSGPAGPGPSSSGGGPPLQRSASGRVLGTAPRAVTRKILRKGSHIVQMLKSMVGSSQKIYNQVVELCVVKFRDSDALYVGHKELSYCTLRTQLLMALHDDNSTVASKDRCHELAWTIDAGITNGLLTDKHLQKLEKYFTDVMGAEDRQASRQMAGGKAGKGKGHVQDEAESAGNVAGSLVEPYRVLGEASVVLRDPSALHLLASSVMQLVYTAAVDGKLPRDTPQVAFVTRIMQLATDGRQMLRDRKYRLPEPDARILHNLLPLLAAWMLDFERDGSPAPADMAGEELPGGWGLPKQAVDAAMDVVKRSEVARKLAQTFVLERLLRRDFLSVARACKLLATALGSKAVLEGFDFAGALAQRLADLVKARQLPVGCALWRLAVDQILVRAVDSHTQVHEEVLRLLLAASHTLKGKDMGDYLAQTLENSKKSRKRVSKKQQHSGLDALAGFPMSIASDIGSDIGSDGWPGVLKLKLSASDGVRSVYNVFATRVRDINESTAPALFAYLAEGQEQQQGQGGQQRADAAAADAAPATDALQSPGAQAVAAGDAGGGAPAEAINTDVEML
uniref:Uncharacterized protein n=1 Tax=Chlamydomonas leiostraca TaxID=1034604 RepID=A0A7S0RMM1_9CHLO|mmetsp:Transcript_26245/g.66809  ORF Transcript_26245/g.66809 Transcript_26245/m.66809 type:complete len:776 (+) Transcript_26245:461-2788(+)